MAGEFDTKEVIARVERKLDRLGLVLALCIGAVAFGLDQRTTAVGGAEGVVESLAFALLLFFGCRWLLGWRPTSPRSNRT